MEYRCKICAGTLTIDPKIRIAVCDYCGTKQTLPLFGDDSSKILYDRGNQYLLHNEYDKAESVFTQLLSVNPNDAEIYWDLVLCKYGVTYAKDPQTNRYIPTCNRTHVESVLKDENYIRALDLSVGEKQELYKRDAGIIDNIQKGILEVSKKEKPFDIFISYKETDANGDRTKDSIEAQKIYEKLVNMGYKVFFSRITLESKIGEEYEPYIYAALSSSKIMITVSSSDDNINAAWVKNEWSRFLTLRRGNVEKTLIPVYFDMNVNDLPEEFALLSAQDLKADDFEQEFIRGIKKLVPTPIEVKASRAKGRRILSMVAVGVLAIVCLIGGFKYYKYFRETREANRIKENYEYAASLFGEKKYDEAMKLYKDLGEYEDSADMALKCTYYTEFDAAKELYYDHRYAEATWALQQIGDYSDVNEMFEKSINAWRDSVSTIALTADFSGGRSSSGSYYVNPNGTVESFAFDPGNYNEKLIIDSDGSVIGKEDMEAVGNHGRIISIAANYPALYALYEDGYVCNSAALNKLDADWENIVQISDLFGVTNVALTKEGTISYGNTIEEGWDTNQRDNSHDDSWLIATNSWNNIVKMDYRIERQYSSGTLATAVLVGLDSNGKVNYATYEYVDYVYEGYFSEHISHKDNMEEFLNSLEDIRDIQISNSYIAAYDNNGVMHIFCFDDGKSYTDANIRYLWSDDADAYIVDTKNCLKKLNSNAVLLEGIVYLRHGYCVSQSGTIYKCNGKTTDSKTIVKDVWLER